AESVGGGVTIDCVFEIGGDHAVICNRTRRCRQEQTPVNDILEIGRATDFEEVVDHSAWRSNCARRHAQYPVSGTSPHPTIHQATPIAARLSTVAELIRVTITVTY